MPRTVDEILRSKGRQYALNPTGIVRIRMRIQGGSYEEASEWFAAHCTADPTERAALVSHMVEQRDRQPAGKA